LKKRITRAMLVTIGVVVLVLSLGMTAAAADNSKGEGGRTCNGDSLGQQAGWQQGVVNGDKLQTGERTGMRTGSLQQNGWQQKSDKGNQQQSGDCSCAKSVKEVAELSEIEANWLIYMREEEKLARDVYQVLYEKWGSRIFDNIAASEQNHTDALEKLLEKYGITDPVTDENVLGSYINPKLNTLYDELKTRGLTSLQVAYQVGFAIEELDIEDLQEAIADSGAHADIVRVYHNLLGGSENHLAAFSSQLD